MTTDPNTNPNPGPNPDPNQVPQDAQNPAQTPQTPPTPPTPPQYESGAGNPQDIPQEPVNPGAYRPSGASYESYGAPPPAGPYGSYGSYGSAGTPPTGGAYAAPLGQPVPAGMRDIWQKWLNVTTRPGVASFAQELPTANWRDIWLSLVGLGILTAITGAIAALYTSQTITIPRTDGTSTTIHIPTGTSWFTIIGVPLAFFIGVAILFVVAKLFGGTGTFLEQSYAMMLYYVPIQAVTAVLGLLPFFGGLAAFVLGIYEIVLAVFAIAASQRLTTGKSVAVVLLPAVILILLSCALLVIFIAAIAAALNGTR